jgi:hypothetical protein
LTNLRIAEIFNPNPSIRRFVNRQSPV